MTTRPVEEVVPKVTLYMWKPLGLATEDTSSGRAAAAFHDILEQATPETVPTGILDTMPPRFLPLQFADGGEDVPALSQAEWQSCIEALLVSRLERAAPIAGASAMLDMDTIEERAAAHRAKGHLPIFVADVDYHAIRGRAWVAIERASQAPAGAPRARSVASGTDLFESRRAFLASAMLPTVFAEFAALPHVLHDRQIDFVVPSDGLLGDAFASTALTIDFGDGEGPRSIERDAPVSVTYGDAGTKLLTLVADGPRGRSTAHFRLAIADREASTFPPPDYVAEHWPDLPAHAAWPGTAPSVAQVRVWRHVQRRLAKPVILVEGFPANYPWEVIERYIQKGDFARKLADQGHDLVLVRFPSGPARLQNNAYALVEVIREVLKRREGNDPLIVGGFSMGGLLARYALAYMEHEHRRDPTRMEHHQARVLFTVDTPHEGANVPVSAQALAQYYASMGAGARARQMRSDAAQQMLYLSVPELGQWRDGLEIGPSPLRQEFLTELARVGGPNGMPREVPSTIAVANGDGTGKEWVPAGEVATRFFCIWHGTACTFPRGEDDSLVAAGGTWGRNEWRIRTPHGYGFDSAPGGVFEDPIFRAIYDSSPKPDRSIAHENACFIPTTSALAISGIDQFFAPPDLSRSKFKYVTFSWTGNQNHAWLDETLSEFLIKFIEQPADAAPGGAETGQ
ncbi:MAG TPA: hypothetical protein VHB25_11545 [Gemmatimonadaceae bacterium]|nr:hypothetical protein [Gemmatimonadaceae bacterium]